MWALAVTAPNAENLVCRELSVRHGVPFHFFLQNKRLVQRGRVVERAVPAFPGYVLVPFEAAWGVVRDCWRVINLVHFREGAVSQVPQSVVDDLLGRCVGDHVLPAVEVPEPFKIGERVHVGGAGPMSGHYGTYQHRVDLGRLCVSFDCMGRWVSIAVDERDVSSGASVSAVLKKKKHKHRSRRKHRSQSLSG